jgi:hypothetical protein
MGTATFLIPPTLAWTLILDERFDLSLHKAIPELNAGAAE